LPKDI